jgi:hypothetical protein
MASDRLSGCKMRYATKVGASIVGRWYFLQDERRCVDSFMLLAVQELVLSMISDWVSRCKVRYATKVGALMAWRLCCLKGERKGCLFLRVTVSAR